MGEKREVNIIYLAHLFAMLALGFAVLPRDDADEFIEYVKSWNPDINLGKMCKKGTCIVFIRRERERGHSCTSRSGSRTTGTT